MLGLVSYVVYVVLMMIGLYAAIAKRHLAKKVIGLSLFQTGIFVFYISLGVVDGGTAPIFVGDAHHTGVEGSGHEEGHDPAAKPVVYTNPLPHVLILTAIVVSVSTMAVALAILVGIKHRYGTLEADEILALESEP